MGVLIILKKNCESMYQMVKKIMLAIIETDIINLRENYMTPAAYHAINGVNDQGKPSVSDAYKNSYERNSNACKTSIQVKKLRTLKKMTDAIWSPFGATQLLSIRLIQRINTSFGYDR